MLSYIVSFCLLFIIQPIELIVFPLTTGILGIAIGYAFRLLKRRLLVIIGGAICLALGIMILLYIIQFPVLGPGVSMVFHPAIVGGIFVFTFIYSWLWVEIGIVFFRRLKVIILS